LILRIVPDVEKLSHRNIATSFGFIGYDDQNIVGIAPNGSILIFTLAVDIPPLPVQLSV
jgi:hypothetical protein